MFTDRFLILEDPIDWSNGLKNITCIKNILDSKNLIADITFDIKQLNNKDNYNSINKPYLKRNMLVYDLRKRKI